MVPTGRDGDHIREISRRTQLSMVILTPAGHGAILGERAVLEGGLRTSTVKARTRCRVAAARGDQVDEVALAELSEGHRKEEG